MTQANDMDNTNKTTDYSRITFASSLVRYLKTILDLLLFLPLILLAPFSSKERLKKFLTPALRLEYLHDLIIQFAIIPAVGLVLGLVLKVALKNPEWDGAAVLCGVFFYANLIGFLPLALVRRCIGCGMPNNKLRFFWMAFTILGLVAGISLVSAITSSRGQHLWIYPTIVHTIVLACAAMGLMLKEGRDEKNARLVKASSISLYVLYIVGFMALMVTAVIQSEENKTNPQSEYERYYNRLDSTQKAKHNESMRKVLDDMMKTDTNTAAKE